MGSIANLVSWSEPSAVAIQSGVLVLFFAAFIFLTARLSTKKNKEICEKIATQFFAD